MEIKSVLEMDALEGTCLLKRQSLSVDNWHSKFATYQNGESLRKLEDLLENRKGR
jgi:hypothetical protein